MSKKGENIFLRKDGRYEGRFIKGYENNRAIYGSVYAKTYSECKRKKNNALIEKKNSILKKRKKYENLYNLSIHWLKNKNKIKESSYTKYYGIIDKHIKNSIGSIKINKLNEKIINNYIKRKENEKLSTNTIYSICNIFKQIFKENSINITTPKIKINKKSGKCLSLNEKQSLKNMLLNSNNLLSIGILLSLFLGLRESEVCGIKWSDIDLQDNTLEINRIISRVKSFGTKNKTKLIISTPKTNFSKRLLPIPEKIVNKLKKQKNKYQDNCFLLTGTDNYMDPKTYFNNFKKILLKLNINNYTYHDLRHTFASNCIELGMDYKTLMELMGHSNITTTLNIYVHTNTFLKRKFVNQL